MDTRVLKFGGSTLKRNEDLDKIISIVKSSPRPLRLVFSAFYGVTDQLIEALNQVPRNIDCIGELIERLATRKHAFLAAHIQDEEARSEAIHAVNVRLFELRRLLFQIHVYGQVRPDLHDRILSYGERLCTVCVFAVFAHKGINCRELLPEEMGLITDGKWGEASIDFAQSFPLLQAAFAEEIHTITPGFYGISPTGEVNLLGRGGSDYTAAAIAFGIGAQSLDLWKDVDGFMSANPKLVEHCFAIDAMSYDEAAELALWGASILHPRAIKPVRDGSIPIRIFNLNSAQFLDDAPATVIGFKDPGQALPTRSITYTDHVVILEINRFGIGSDPDLFVQCLQALSKAEISIYQTHTSQVSLQFLLPAAQGSAAKQALADLCELETATVRLRAKISLIALIGAGFHTQASSFSSLISDYSDYILSFSTSKLGWYLVVPQNKRDLLIQRIHANCLALQPVEGTPLLSTPLPLP